MRLHSFLGPHRTPCRLANACLECLLGLITALVRYAVKAKEAKGHGDPHVAYRIFADGRLDPESYHLFLPLSLPVFYVLVLLSLALETLSLNEIRKPLADSRCHTMRRRQLESWKPAKR
jgi:hypothetical protein